jgi:23S rRNA pseudouridine2605 synthase
MNKFQKKKDSPKKGSFSNSKNSPKKYSGLKKRGSDESDFKKTPYEKKPFGKSDRFSKNDDKKDSRGKDFEKRSPASFRKNDSAGYKPRETRDDSSSKRDFKKRDEKKSFGKTDRFSKTDDKKDGRGKDFEKRSPTSFRKTNSAGYKPKKTKEGSSSERDFEKKPFGKKSFGKTERFSKSDDKKVGRFSKPDDRKDKGKGVKKVYEKGPARFEKTPQAPEYNFKAPKGKKDNVLEIGQIRLNKYIANSGICSRREADKLIEEGLIKVNEKVVTELGYKVNRSDIVKYEGRILNREKPVYVLLNKPKDFITTMDDPQDRKTVMSLVGSACKERIYPVGRLDRNTTGLLLLTNDGELADKLTHPSNEVKKIYQVDLDKPLDNKDYQKILDGLELEDGPVKVDEIAIVSSDKKSLGIEIHQGRNRIVRRIFEHLGYDVVKLDRVMYAGLTKKELSRGQWRYLTEKEVVHLKHFL